MDVSALVDYAADTEDTGWDSGFLSDSVTRRVTDPGTCLASNATRTDHLQLGTCITPIPRREPWQPVHELATLDQLADGRVMLGGGLGTPSEHEAFDPPSNPDQVGVKHDEALDGITGLWNGGSCSYHGEHDIGDELELARPPVQEPGIPVVLGGWWSNKLPFKRAAGWDGIMPNWPAMTGAGEGPGGEHPTGTVEEELRDMLEEYHDLRDESGESILPLKPANAPPSYPETSNELGATWVLATRDFEPGEFEQNMEHIWQGPPRCPSRWLLNSSR